MQGLESTETRYVAAVMMVVLDVYVRKLLEGLVDGGAEPLEVRPASTFLASCCVKRGLAGAITVGAAVLTTRG